MKFGMVSQLTQCRTTVRWKDPHQESPGSKAETHRNAEVTQDPGGRMDPQTRSDIGLRHTVGDPLMTHTPRHPALPTPRPGGGGENDQGTPASGHQQAA